VSKTRTNEATRQRLFFTSAGKTCLIRADGSGLETLEFDEPSQATWQPGPFLSDGKRVIFLSMEARRDGPGRPFDQYYTQTPTHLWLYDLDRKSLTEIATKERLEVLYAAAFGERRANVGAGSAEQDGAGVEHESGWE